MDKELCEKCGREFPYRTKIVTRQRYGEPTEETEVRQRICKDCAEDLGLDSPFDYEE